MPDTANTLAVSGLAAAVVGGALLLLTTDRKDNNSIMQHPTPDSSRISLAQVQQHRKRETGVWTTWKGMVYDITDFIDQHPGGDIIMLAAGKDLEPYFQEFTVHDSDTVRDILARHKIGELEAEEQTASEKSATSESEQQKAAAVDAAETAQPEQQFLHEPARDPRLVVRTEKPFNAETPLSVLATSEITPNEVFYVRNTFAVPAVDIQNFKLGVEGPAGKQLDSFTMGQLRKMPRSTITVTLQCTGNRRAEMQASGPVQGPIWDRGAIGNAEWTGVRLIDVLKEAGVGFPAPDWVRHVQFEAHDGYGGSIPAHVALDPNADVLLAYDMNGEPLPIDHGYPIRAIVPGVGAARCVKWLHKLILSENESPAHWQQRDYKGFLPSSDWTKLDYTQSPAIQDMPVQSALLYPPDGAELLEDAQELTVQGYAWSGGGRAVVRVDVSVDDGRTWHTAILKGKQQPLHRAWAWHRWQVTIPLNPEETTFHVICKAVDSSYNVQPEHFDGIYNRRGVLSTAWSRATVHRRRKPLLKRLLHGKL